MGLQFKVTGLDQAIANMKSLKVKTQKSLTRKAARKAMNIVRDAARQNARAIDDPETAAMIQKNIVTGSPSAAGNANKIVMRVGVRGGASSNQYSKKILKKVRGVQQIKGDPSLVYLPGGDTRHWRYIEFGTSGFAAVPFMRPALANNTGRVMSTFVTEFRSGINEAIRR